MTIANLINDLKSVQSENTQAIRQLTNLRNTLSGADNGAGVLYQEDVNAIRSYQNQALSELSHSINELQKLNGEINTYIQHITR